MSSNPFGVDSETPDASCSWRGVRLRDSPSALAASPCSCVRTQCLPAAGAGSKSRSLKSKRLILRRTTYIYRGEPSRIFNLLSVQENSKQLFYGQFLLSFFIADRDDPVLNFSEVSLDFIEWHKSCASGNSRVVQNLRLLFQ